MPSVYRLAMPALCLSLLLPCAFSVEAADPAPAATAEKPAEEKPAERQPLLERSQEEAAALERKVRRKNSNSCRPVPTPSSPCGSRPTLPNRKAQ